MYVCLAVGTCKQMFRRHQTREVLPRQAMLYNEESRRCAMLAESNLTTLKNLYSQPDASNFSLQAALEQSQRYTTNAHNKIVAELRKRYQAMERAPDAPLWVNMPDHIVIPPNARPPAPRQNRQGQQQQASTSGVRSTNFAGRQAPRQPVAQQRRQQPYQQTNRRGRGGQNRGGRGRGNSGNRGNQGNHQALGRAVAQQLMNLLRDQF